MKTNSTEKKVMGNEKENITILQLNECSGIYKRNIPIKIDVRQALPCDLFKLLLSILLLLVLILFIKESRYMVFNIDVLVENSEQFIEREKYGYSIIATDQALQSLDNKQCSNVPDALKFDCHPESGASESTCAKRQCCWSHRNVQQRIIGTFDLSTPYCYYPENWSLYKYENSSKQQNGNVNFFEKIKDKSSPYPFDISLISLRSYKITENILNVKISDAKKKRYEPILPINPSELKFDRFGQTSVKSKYKLEISHSQVGFKVTRTDDGTILFNSIGIGGFIFSDQFLQISALLPSTNIYGLGEHRSTFKLSTNWQSFTMFNKDQPPVENANLYGSHPLYLIMEDSGKAHGVLFLNSNAMDVILQPSPGITYRSIGGIFDIYFLLGPTPADVISQYSDLVGRPFLPPYWSLGFHLCRFGYGSLQGTKEVWNRTRAAGIPFDTQWNDLDYMDKNNDFTYDKNKFKNLPQFINHLHEIGMHYIPLIDAGVSAESNTSYIPYDEGVKMQIFVKDATSRQPFRGKVWNFGATVWPDFTNPKTKDYYQKMMTNLHSQVQFDGAWIDMNEPSNFYDGQKNGCISNKFDRPPFIPNVVGGLLAKKTLCMSAIHYAGRHYDIHNTYGTSQAIVTNDALLKIRQKRPFVISRSTWIGHGAFAGHWTGDVFSTWKDLKMSISDILSFNLFQIPMVGADICGFNGNTTIALCNRWVQLGAFYPFSRNHNSDDTIEQDPVAMGGLVVQSAKRALTIRYRLLPYLYTLFVRAHLFGDTVVRPLLFEFPDDRSTYDIDTQFLWGGMLMINPVLEEHQVTVDAYLPRGLWYDYYTKKPIAATGKRYTLNAPLDTIPLLVRGGSILPAQKPGTTTTESRKNNFELIIALDPDGAAKGELYWDDGEAYDSYKKKDFLSIKYMVKNRTLCVSQDEETNYDPKLTLSKIEVWGETSIVRQVVLHGQPLQFEYDIQSSYLSVTGLNCQLQNKFELHWIITK